MKKNLGIIIFSLIFISNAKAETCGFTWSIRDNPGLTIPYFVRFDFKNDTSDVAKISGVKLYTQSNKIVIERVFKKRGSDGKILEPKYVKPNSETMIAFDHGSDLPWDIIKKASIDCVAITYDQYENELLGISNKRNTNNMNVTAPRTDKFRTWHIFAAIGVFFTLALLFDVIVKKIKFSRKGKIKKKIIRMLGTIGLVIAIFLILKGGFDIIMSFLN